MENIIENSALRVKIKSKGAELFSIVNKGNDQEYMWGADPAFWAKSSPILFPIVGALKENTYYYKDKKYTLPRHGFARDESFEVDELKKDAIVFVLRSSTASLEKYPFHFELRIKYELVDNFLHTYYEVTNTGDEEMYFSVGAHPAFKVPLSETLQYEDYYLEFNQKENARRWPITKDGLIESQTQPLLSTTHVLPLKRELFYNDALVLKNLRSDCISLKTTSNENGFDFYFDGFPYLGLWAQKDADFVCIEPWCGIADSVTHDQQLINKEGIEKINASEAWSRTWKVKIN